MRNAQPEQSLDLEQSETEKKKRRGLKTPILRSFNLSRIDFLCLVLPIIALVLWAISLQHVSVYDMNDLGLISVLSPRIIIALIILIFSFCIALHQTHMRPFILMAHVLFLIVILYGTENTIGEAPHLTTLYRHAGYIEYILRTGAVLPNFDVYSSWPYFFVLGAFLTRSAGYQTILSYAGWAPVFYNLIYLGPMYMIFTSMTTNKRLIWLGIWFFYLTNWVQQDYFSPQGLNLFLYLVIVAILLKWFRIPLKGKPGASEAIQRQRMGVSRLILRFLAWLKATDPFVADAQPWQRQALLACLILIFGLVVASHPLTPFATLASVTALVVFRRCRPFWLPVLMAGLIAAWFYFMARSFLVGHQSFVTGTFGDVSNNLTASVTARSAQGDALHQIIARIRIMMTAVLWGLAFLGAVRRVRLGYKDLTYLLLTIAPFSLIVAGNYGGEMFLRIYFFSLPFMAFFAAALFYGKRACVMHKNSFWKALVMLAATLVLLGGFFFTRYGNERLDYITYADLDGVQYLYQVAPPGSLLIEAWNDTPWEYQDDEKYAYESMTEILPNTVLDANINDLTRFIESQNRSRTYLIFTRSSAIEAYALYGLPENAIENLEEVMVKSKEFQLVYSNHDVQIFLFLEPSSARKISGY